MTSSNEFDFLTAIGIIPLSIAEYSAIDAICVQTEPKFRTSPLDIGIDDADYKRQLENRVNNLSARSDRPSMTLAAGPDEWRSWLALKLKAQNDAIESARSEISDTLRSLSLLDQPTRNEIDEEVAVCDSKTDDILPTTSAPKIAFIEATDALVPDRRELQRSLATFIKSVDQFELFEASNYDSGDTSLADLETASRWTNLVE